MAKTASGAMEPTSAPRVLFILGLIGPLLFSRRFAGSRERGWAGYSLATGIAMLLVLILAGIRFKQAAGLVDVAGVLQRLSIAIGFVWVSLLSVRMMR